MVSNHRKEFQRDIKDARWSIFQIFGYIVIPALVLVVILGFATGVINLASQPGKVIQKTFDADNMVYNYEWFKQKNQDIEATKRKIKTAEDTLSTFVETNGTDRSQWDYTIKEEYGRLSTVVQGLKNYKDDQIADYNAKSQMANRSIFKSGDLPERINK